MSNFHFSTNQRSAVCLCSSVKFAVSMGGGLWVGGDGGGGWGLGGAGILNY